MAKHFRPSVRKRVYDGLPTAVVSVLAGTLLCAVVHAFVIPSTFARSLPAYAIQLTTPAFLYAVSRGRFQAHTIAASLVSDFIFSLAIAAHILVAGNTPSSLLPFVIIKLFGSVLMFGWDAVTQAVSVSFTIALYWAAVAFTSHELNQTELVIHIATPFMAGAFSLVGALHLESGRRHGVAQSNRIAESEARLREMVDNGPDGILAVRNGLTAFANAALLRLLGYQSPEPVTNRHLLDLVHLEDRAAVDRYISEAAAGRPSTTSLEIRMLRIDGGLVDVAVRAARVWIDEQDGVQLVIRDITDRKRAEREARAAEDRFRIITENALDMIGVLDTDGRFRYASPSFEKQLGYSASDYTGLSVFDLIHPDDRPEVLRIFRSGIASPDTRVDVKLRMRHRDGRWLVLEAAGRNLLDDPVIKGFVINSREITERSRAESERESLLAVNTALALLGQELIASIEAPDVIQRLCRLSCEVLDGEVGHTFLRQHDRWIPVAHWGSSPEDWESFRQLEIPSSMVTGFEQAVDRETVIEIGASDRKELAGQGVVALQAAYGITRGTFIALRRAGRIIGAQAVGLRDPRRTFSETHRQIAYGISHIGSLALQNAQLVGELERANSVKADFVATMSHELRTPLNVIIGYSDMLLDGAMGDINADQRDTIARVRNSGSELLDLVSATLDLSRLEQGRISVEPRPVQLAEMMGEIDAETRAAGLSSNVRLLWRLPSDLPRVLTDPVKLKIILKNLVGNAVKFTESGSITIGLRSVNRGVEIAVTDTGIGIAPEAAEKIFEPFTQANQAIGARFGGAGLGLHIVRRLVELLGGQIRVDSTPGKGSTFTVWIPHDEATVDSPARLRAASNAAS